MVHVLPDAASLALAAAARVIRSADEALARGGRFDMALSGGRTPQGLYRRLAAAPDRERIDWPRVGIWYADERAVPPDNPESNYRMSREALLDHVPIPPENVHRMPAEEPDLAEAAARYERVLPARLDLVILGIGEDGHFASIFPGSPLTAERIRRVAAVFDSPKPPPRRLTTTPRSVREARDVIVLASGAEKASAVRAALEGDADIVRCPARMLRPYDWFLDEEAAARLATTEVRRG